MKKYFVFIAILGLNLFYSCEDEEIIQHENLTQAGGAPAPYEGIPSILIENYVTKLYIDFIGQKPDEIELDDAVKYLKDNGLSEASREKVISDLTKTQAYHDRLFQINTDLLLNGIGRDEIQQQYDLFTFVRQQVLQQGDTFAGQYYEYELEKLQAVLDAQQNYEDGLITMNTYFWTFCYNFIYDEINMGSENFVVACFENIFKRYPTNNELTNGASMVDGASVTLLRQSGRTKIDFLDIVTEDVEFYQGRVLDSYNALLLRAPTSEELTEATVSYQTSKDFEQMQIDIAKTDEYAGFE